MNEFEWRDSTGACIVPGKALHEGKLKDTLVRSENCTKQQSHWVWTTGGQLKWNEGNHTQGVPEKVGNQKI